MKLDNNQYSNLNLIKNIVLIVIIIVITIGYFIYNGTISFGKRTQENQHQREPVFETLLAFTAYFEPITINLIEAGGTQDETYLVLQAGIENNLKEYKVIVDNNFVKAKEGIFAVKTNDTYVKIDGTNYYLYAYIEDGEIKYGLAK